MTDFDRDPLPDPESAQPAPPPREPVFNLPGVVVSIVAVMAVIEAIRSFLLSGEVETWLMLQAAFIPARYDGPVDGSWVWSPVTYSLLHGGWMHLILNSVWLAAFGAVIARRIGTIRFVLFWIASSVAAAAFFGLLHRGEVIVMVGASGVVSALMAAATRFAFAGRGGFISKYAHLNPRLTLGQTLAHRSAFTFLAVWFGINLLAGFGVSPGSGEVAIAWEAHLGGFLFGFFCFDYFDPYPEEVPGARS
ncbi:MAG: rhomboid family intramembrane serine protease [Rhizobiales bacterium]|nr:rhomboid family intramembrane serine protease [Hyphomicrobiales bacterium]MBG18558.1 rhomboid family intramembrane serine protease [Hyphomicrobiales bacterium]